MSDSVPDNGEITRRTRHFYTHKTIQRSYNYLVYFSLSNSLIRKLGSTQNELERLDMYATSVELPGGYDFKKEYYAVGSFVKSFPVLDHNGFEFTIKFEEDDQGTVKNLINVLTRSIIDSNGYYKKFNDAVVDNIIISTYRHDGTNVYKAFFENAYLLKSSNPTFSFNSSEKIEYDLTFNADHFHIDFGTAANNSNFQAP